MDSTSCPTSLTWLEGTRETLSCGAAGNPTPIVTCTHRGDPPSTAGPILVTRSHAGIYHCNATNSVGTRSRIVTVRVECEWGEWGALQGALGMNGVVALGGLRLVVGLGDAKYGHILLGKVGMWGEGDWLGAKRGRFGSDVG